MVGWMRPIRSWHSNWPSVPVTTDGGPSLTGPGGLLGRLIKVVLEGALGRRDGRLPSYTKHDPAGRDGGNTRNGHRSQPPPSVGQVLELATGEEWVGPRVGVFREPDGRPV